MNRPYNDETQFQYEYRMKSKFHIWLSAARPKTLWAAIAPVIIGTAMAFSDGKLHLPSALLALFAAMLIQIGTNFANDYFDFVHGVDTRDRLGPTRATGAGLVKPNQMKWAFILTFTLAFLLGLYLIYRGGWPILVIGILSILCGVLYTSGPYPLSYNGLGDIFVLIFFGPVAVGGTYYLQALDITLPVILAGLSPGLISTALLTVNNLRDIYTDRKAGKKTLAVRFGEFFSRMEYLVAMLIACFMPVLLIVIKPGHPYASAAISVFLFALPSIRAVLFQDIDARLNLVLARTGKLLLLYSLIFSLGWIV
jgi:1,4-dihydroxy-2-naphthoate octaprenyltransferase